MLATVAITVFPAERLVKPLLTANAKSVLFTTSRQTPGVRELQRKAERCHPRFVSFFKFSCRIAIEIVKSLPAFHFSVF